MPPIAQPPLPSFEVRLTAPDIGRWLAGNTGIVGFTTRTSVAAGPHVALLGITHGNEIAGAIVLDRLLRARLEPTRGRLTFGFVNLAAYERFDPRQPTLTRARIALMHIAINFGIRQPVNLYDHDAPRLGLSR